MPWGQELTVFEQNTGARDTVRARYCRSTCTGTAPTRSCSMHEQDAFAGVETGREQRLMAQAIGERRAPRRRPPEPPAETEATQSDWATWLLLSRSPVAGRCSSSSRCTPWWRRACTTPRAASTPATRWPGTSPTTPMRSRTTSHELLRSFVYAGIATILCLLLGYPLAYAIAFKAGRWRNLMLVLVIAPFFTSFLIRTLAWQLILADQGGRGRRLRSTCTCSAADGRLAGDAVRRDLGLTYNFLPFMVLPLVRRAGEDRPAADRGRRRPLRLADPRLLQGDLAAVARRRRGGHAADVHPGGGRLHQRRAAREHRDQDDRQRHPGPVHGRR